MRFRRCPAIYDDLVEHALPVERDELAQLRGFAPRFAELCAELAGRGIPETVQHDDLHAANVYERLERLRVLDWGDASISHPFMSLVMTFRFLEQTNRLPPIDPCYARLRNAYLEPWGRDLADTFALAVRVGTFAHTFVWVRQRDALPRDARPDFDEAFHIVLRRAIDQTVA
jgi:aminoglycoside phosphotransferase (APT) family kinase protein